MLKTKFSLISKRALTHDVYELVYRCSDMTHELPSPGQYVMFQLAPGLNRAYSIADFENDTFTLIIKRIADGRGSPMICDAQIGMMFSGILPLGHFVLQNTQNNKCFIGTGTGFAPLYCQFKNYLKSGSCDNSIAFIFGVRTFADSFYESEIAGLGQELTDFQYVQYFSRESQFSQGLSREKKIHRSGYVTDWITIDNIAAFQEFYICGSPAMVKGARETLEALGVQKQKIFWEQF